MKILGWGLAIIFAALFTLSSLEKEEEELDYVMDSMSFLIRWNSDQSYAMSCNEESESKEITLLAWGKSKSLSIKV